jgi:hypothetical protein
MLHYGIFLCFFRVFLNLPLHFGMKYGIIKKLFRQFGVLAQLGERHTGSVEVSGSIPLCSTKNDLQKWLYTAVFGGFLFTHISFRIVENGKI